jgi:hypothetical protein
MRLHTCIFGGFFLYWLYVRNDFPSVGQVGEAGACKAGGESHFGQGTLRLLFVEDIFVGHPKV